VVVRLDRGRYQFGVNGIAILVFLMVYGVGMQGVALRIGEILRMGLESD
jgi:hypothetical protein